jgi:hypothetical protein
LLPNSVVARDAILSDDAIRQVVAAAYEISEPLGLYVQTHAELGSRPSQLARCFVADLLNGKLLVPASHKGRNGGRGGNVAIPLGPNLAARLKQAAAGRAPHELLFRQEDGSSWRDSHKRPFEKARTLAGLPADVTIYWLRHSSVVRALLKNVPVKIVADWHDTSVAMIEKHYGRYVVRHSDEWIRTALIDTSPQQATTNDNVVKLRS